MRDLIRNYKNIISGRNVAESDTESQPLCSSSSSSSYSFGSFFNPSTPTSDTDLENGDSYKTLVPFYKTRVASNPIACMAQKKYDRNTLYGSIESSKSNIFLSTESKKSGTDSSYSTFWNTGSMERTQYNLELDSNIFKLSSTLSSGGNLNSNSNQISENKESTQSSLVTIFAIWNATMGTSFLTMSWGLGKAGLFPGILINFFVGALCLYMCYLLVNVYEKHGRVNQLTDVSSLCLLLLGKWAAILAKVFSIIVLWGAVNVYLVLMSNFLFHSVDSLHYLLSNHSNETTLLNTSAICFNGNVNNFSNSPALDLEDVLYNSAWNLHSTVPIYLALILFGVLSVKSPTYFAKFNCLGTISVFYILGFVITKASMWDINIPDWRSQFQLKSTFPALSGMLSMSYFTHSIIISVVKNNRRQDKCGRNLSIAFALISFTYIFIGVIFYISFSLDKSCIQDNFLNNFTKGDPLAIIARILLMFQLLTISPLLASNLRNDILTSIYAILRATLNVPPRKYGFGELAAVNFGILVICVLFACFLPKIGTLTRYTGALGGLVYIFMLPNLLKLATLKKEGNLTAGRKVFHYGIVVLGSLNLITQFFIVD